MIPFEFEDDSPHKALPRSACGEKHPRAGLEVLKGRQRGYPKRSVHRNNVVLRPIPNLPPFQGDSVLLGVFPGLKPWAESCCPFGTKSPRHPSF
jgi:hypothetical protein